MMLRIVEVEMMEVLRVSAVFGVLTVESSNILHKFIIDRHYSHYHWHKYFELVAIL
jgi:hypothetical protein